MVKFYGGARRQCGSGYHKHHGGRSMKRHHGGARRQCGSGYHKHHGGRSMKRHHGGAHRQCGSGYHKHHGGRSMKRHHGGARRQCGSGYHKHHGGKRSKTQQYSLRGGNLCTDGGYSVNVEDSINGPAGAPVGAVVSLRGGNNHHKYDCKQPNWGPECL
jgi:hypothetical protein